MGKMDAAELWLSDPICHGGAHLHSEAGVRRARCFRNVTLAAYLETLAFP